MDEAVKASEEGWVDGGEAIGARHHHHPGVRFVLSSWCGVVWCVVV